MNYYTNTSDYYNYVNNNYNQPIYNQNMKSTPVQKNINQDKKLFEPYAGFIRGNMFPDLYNGYKLTNPFDVTPLNEQAEMLTMIDALCFAMIDLNLYLDVYPNDRKMIDLYNQYRMQNEEMKMQYEKKYGPLTINSAALKNYPWTWDNAPWPWEGK